MLRNSRTYVVDRKHARGPAESTKTYQACACKYLYMYNLFDRYIYYISSTVILISTRYTGIIHVTWKFSNIQQTFNIIY